MRLLFRCISFYPLNTNRRHLSSRTNLMNATWLHWMCVSLSVCEYVLDLFDTQVTVNFWRVLRVRFAFEST